MENSIEAEAEEIVVVNEETSSTINVEPLLSQHLQEFDNIFSLGGQEFHLNSSGTKRLVVGITSREIPELKVTFKLHDTKNGWCIQFSKRTWDAIVHQSDIITSHLELEVYGEILYDNRIRISTTLLYNRVCVVFTDRAEVRIVMTIETFNTMMRLKDEINHTYTEMNKNIKDVTKRIKLFMDLSFFHLFKSNNIDCRHNYNWLNLFMNNSENFLGLNRSIANTWLELGKWIDTRQEQEQASSPTSGTSTANDT